MKPSGKFKIEGEIDVEYLEELREAIESIRGYASIDVAKITVEARTVINLA